MCISIVASAFQYGCAPTLIPATMMLISPPSWVNVMIRRSARDTQSMFSVPLSIEMVAPEDRANHSTGADSSSARSSAATTRAHSASATVPKRFRRVTEHGHPGHAFGVQRRAPRHQADDEPGGVASIRPVHRSKFARFVEVVFDELAVAAGENRDQFVRVDQAAGLRALHLLCVLVERRATARLGVRSHSPRSRRPECTRSGSPRAGVVRSRRLSCAPG